MSRPASPLGSPKPAPDTTRTPPASARAGALRQRAEARFNDHAASQGDTVAEPLPQAVQKPLHELQVHQIELELQNDELRQSHLDQENARARYFDLYDLAPVGYVTVGANGSILEANLTAATLLGVNRGALVTRPLHAFIAREDQDGFYLLCKQMRETGSPQSGEVRMNRVGGAQLWVHLMATATTDADGVCALRMALSDISALKSIEHQLFQLAHFDALTGLPNRLLAAAAHPMRFKDHLLRVSASLGVTFCPQAQEVEGDQLMRQADQAMYLAKQAGKNCYQVFDAERESSLRCWHEDLQGVRQALDEGEFLLYHQPKVNLRTGQLVGVEALIRWQHPAKGLRLPGSFLPVVVVDHALAIPIGEWVINTALGQMEAWQVQGLQVSVNVGARQFYLRRLRVASLKIDQSFVQNMLDDPDDLAILKGIISLANAFKCDVIAEGVETEAHGILLMQLGCDLVQGYCVARPMPAQDLRGWITGRAAQWASKSPSAHIDSR
jgi:PAS domain S-box-containing protein